MSVVAIKDVKRQRWLFERIANACPNCGQRNWRMTDEAMLPFALRTTDAKPLVIRSMVVAPVVCAHCNLILTFALERAHFGDSEVRQYEVSPKGRQWARFNGFLIGIAVADLTLLIVLGIKGFLLP